MFQNPEGNGTVNLQSLGLSKEDMDYFYSYNSYSYSSYNMNETGVNALNNNSDPCNSGVPSESSGKESSICEPFQLDIVSFSVSTCQYVKNSLFIHGL